MSSSNSPCAACKFLRRKCTQDCVFAPYFPPDQPQKFANVHRVFGASNVAKILNELNKAHREDAVNSLAYEANARLQDPVYGCVGLISLLQHRLKQVQSDLHNAKLELANYIGPSAMLPILNQGFIPQIPNLTPSSSVPAVLPYNMQPMLGINHHQQILESLQQQQQQSGDLVRFNGGFDADAGSVQVNGVVFNPTTDATADMSPALALGTSYVDNMYQIHQQPEQPQEQNHHLHLQPHQILLQQETQQALPLQKRAPSTDDRTVAPSG